MTNREHMISLLQGPADKETIQYFKGEFGCAFISSEECFKHSNCFDCWKHWLESEVSTNDHA